MPGYEEVQFTCVDHFVVVRFDSQKICYDGGGNSKCQTFWEKCDRALCTNHFKVYSVGTLASELALV
jgi:hypothetical protein